MVERRGASILVHSRSRSYAPRERLSEERRGRLRRAGPEASSCRSRLSSRPRPPTPSATTRTSTRRGLTRRSSSPSITRSSSGVGYRACYRDIARCGGRSVVESRRPSLAVVGFHRARPPAHRMMNRTIHARGAARRRSRKADPPVENPRLPSKSVTGIRIHRRGTSTLPADMRSMVRRAAVTLYAGRACRRTWAATSSSLLLSSAIGRRGGGPERRCRRNTAAFDEALHETPRIAASSQGALATHDGGASSCSAFQLGAASVTPGSTTACPRITRRTSPVRSTDGKSVAGHHELGREQRAASSDGNLDVRHR